MMIYILRIGHRPGRDKRITTHVALVGRAFGADAIYIYRPDSSIKKSVDSINKRFGGSFDVVSIDSWRPLINSWKGTIIHLTMYGLSIQDLKEKIKKDYENNNNLLVVVGAEKVPGEIYKVATYNVAITNQPHSEVAALAIFLYELFSEKIKKYNIEEGILKIIPQAHGKKVVETKSDNVK